jgi:hypothetical protein
MGDPDVKLPDQSCRELTDEIDVSQHEGMRSVAVGTQSRRNYARSIELACRRADRKINALDGCKTRLPSSATCDQIIDGSCMLESGMIHDDDIASRPLR